MHTPAHGRAGGKVILLGEHVVVYGRPALATGLPLAVDAVVESGPGPRLVSEATRAVDGASPPSHDPRGARLVANAARALGLDGSRLVVRVRSDVPFGRGLGSSAALSVAVLRAVAAAAGRELDVAETLAFGRELEGIFHGTPSGVDPAAAALGTCFRFVRGEPPLVTPIALARPIRLVIAYGDDARSTGTTVGGLRERWQQDRARYEVLFDDVARIVEDGIAAARVGDLAALGAAFDRNQALLEQLGVSSGGIAALVHTAKTAGALGAKLTGGGGGGAIIAVGRDPDDVAGALRADGATVLVVDVGGVADARDGHAEEGHGV
jgi:mevalonate kinase